MPHNWERRLAVAPARRSQGGLMPAQTLAHRGGPVRVLDTLQAFTPATW
jgi:hypothetical protein